MKKVICKGLFGEVAEVLPEELRFRPSIYAVVVRDGKVLLAKQWDGWDYPGGGIELGERLEEALLREVKEETGLTVKVGKLLTVADSFFQPTFAKDEHWHGIKMYYACSYVSGEISTDGFAPYEKEYMQAAEWVPLDRIPSLKFFNQVDNVALVRSAA